jgi:hypothetical protein
MRRPPTYHPPKTCAICGKHVGCSRIIGFTGWEGPDGEVVGREVVVVVHKECYLCLSPDERNALLEAAPELDVDDRAGRGPWR